MRRTISTDSRRRFLRDSEVVVLGEMAEYPDASEEERRIGPNESYARDDFHVVVLSSSSPHELLVLLPFRACRRNSYRALFGVVALSN